VPDTPDDLGNPFPPDAQLIRQFLVGDTPQAELVIKIGKPPALPGDSKSLTFTGVLKVFKFIQNRML
jgi:hypothetical protein